MPAGCHESLITRRAPVASLPANLALGSQLCPELDSDIRRVGSTECYWQFCACFCTCSCLFEAGVISVVPPVEKKSSEALRVMDTYVPTAAQTLQRKQEDCFKG
ncbi:hypothetical protein BaRGS_00011880 [Batillaria attramentaria]|uniref:Uncharacterized protein n=1 Tax=Batillaria attramentaria TaxID=370345 RepID=A0ABD0LC86_9CAEN